MSIAKSVTSPVSNTKGKTVEYDSFAITDIPAAMDNMGWVMGPKLMRRWFSGKAWVMDNASRSGKIDASALPRDHKCTDVITMKWALQYPQVQKAMEELFLGWKSRAGIRLLVRRLKMLGWTPDVPELILESEDKSVDQIHDSAQVNFRYFGKAIDTIDDMYGAIGKGTLNIAVSGVAKKHLFYIEKVGFYIKDTYDFTLADKTIATYSPSNFLGVWNKERCLNKVETTEFFGGEYWYVPGVSGPQLGILSPILFESKKKYAKQGFVAVFNQHFNAWREARQVGGDFVLFSDVAWFDVHDQPGSIVNLFDCISDYDEEDLENTENDCRDILW
ncbi:DUF6402 family protein [Zooshikella harenae]|uniref:Uncharacterized protein n=1 Tax=Zooshikella harenae TaxID=2827238 RepID=A0ABS5ZKJ8_9GAMM|nr:DUF6402 family protein [Zooshikella harenae]MBU2713532.1 hypothetical protein [Zooshikella harenae]